MDEGVEIQSPGLETEWGESMTLPPLVEWDGQASSWKKYTEDVFAIFYDDFIKTQPRFRDCWVRCYKEPIFDGKEGGFWHCVTFDADHQRSEKERVPDLRRCERIRWPRFMIENVGSEGLQIDYWTNTRGNRGAKKRHLLWLQEEYLVVLEEHLRRDKPTVFYLVTAYLTNNEHTREKLRRERS